MQTTLDLKKLYEKDEHLWLFENARLLREGHASLGMNLPERSKG